MNEVLPQKSFQLIPCESPLWAPDRHTQTILGDWLPSPVLSHPGEKWVLKLPDNDQIICRVYDQKSPWVATLCHGLTGSANASYMQRTAREMLRLGYSVVLMNHRNCGEGKGLARKPYHCGKSDDIGYVVAQVRKRFVGKKVLTVGFSLSANALLLLMSRVVPHERIFSHDIFEDRKKDLDIDLPDIAMTVNAPINLEKTCRTISHSLNRIYEFSFMSSLHYLIKDLEKSGNLEVSSGLHPLMKTAHFDRNFTAPRGGFESAHHYYEVCSAMNYVDRIDRPTACLTSMNDPFIDFRDYAAGQFSSSVRVHIEASGGHMGYLTRKKTPLGSHRWLDYGISEITQTLIAQG